jgi:hypothetical protein
MPDNDRLSKDQKRMLSEIDLLLDGEAGGDGARLQAQIDADPVGADLFHYSQSLNLALKQALEAPDPPKGMWERLDVDLRREPLPRSSWLDRLHSSLLHFFRFSPRNMAIQGGAFLFLITCGTLWWDGGASFFPPLQAHASGRSATRALDRLLSDQLDREASQALEQMLYDFHTEQSLQMPILGAPEGTSGKQGFE